MTGLRSKLALLQQHSLATQLEAEIERLILGGVLRVGDRVNEVQLAERFGVSRSPVREALRTLEASGLIEAVPNRGIFVRRVDTATALKVYGVRAALFGYAAQLLAEAGSDGDLGRLAELHATMGSAAEAHRFADYFPLNFAFHEFIVEAGGNDVLAAQYRGLVKQLRLFRGQNLMTGDTMEVSHREHQAIVDAVLARDPVRAYRAAFDHVELGRHRVMARAAAEDDADIRPTSGGSTPAQAERVA
ncbi:hypothetical protein ASG43_19415 [Aureimonas sp. Leaf454]|uniref:GntR family transcriptional regulator n=1 Tax=Aureimonas sp. Leaf454 TaxID=1736381 RepID=UPI0006FF4113|nr:FCD domain-containing protein [Aureimonas sp. Leaf454]KQT53147.1 hypothetical protein ASG43_19415 [Aureimonas sp. Leaf454]